MVSFSCCFFATRDLTFSDILDDADLPFGTFASIKLRLCNLLMHRRQGAGGSFIELRPRPDVRLSKCHNSH